MFSAISTKWPYMVVAVLAFSVPAWAQFNSGSTGDDGALTFPANAGVILFDPSTFNPPLDPERDNVYNFTTITIPAGTTVKLSGRILSGPVVWLATGPVEIGGTIDLNGEAGHRTSTLTILRVAAFPGAGGYPGGVGGRESSGLLAQPGLGPGGGAAGTPTDRGGKGGTFGGNSFLVPLFGGSGGGGNLTDPLDARYGNGGGAGGGAILIASSQSISSAGQILANGGSGGNSNGGAGSGGAIRLMAPTISTGGVISAAPGVGQPASNGQIRIEAFIPSIGGAIGPFTTGSPFATFVQPSAGPEVRVTTVDGVPVSQNPTGSFEVPDVSINNASPVPIQIEANNVPVGTVVNLQIISENGPDILVDSTPLAGTFESSAATATVTFPSGFSRGFVVVSF